jgi:hypothetical protein
MVRRSRSWVLLGAIALAGAVPLLVDVAAHADDVSSSDFATYTVSAESDAALITVVDPSAPLVTGGLLVQASPATAQAAVDSLGDSTGFASLPYPGAFVATLPGTVDGLLGTGPPVPPYPFYVASSYPSSPSVSQTNGPYSISSISNSTSTTAQALVGLATGIPQVTTITANATASQQSDGSLVADATNDVEALTVGSLLRIGSIVSSVHVVSVPGQPLSYTRALQLGTITVGGIPIGLTDKGLVLGNNVVAGPSVGALTKLLSGAGITLTYLPERVTSTSIDSGGVELTISRDIPDQGNVVTTIVLGETSVTLQDGLPPAAPDNPFPISITSPAVPPLFASSSGSQFLGLASPPLTTTTTTLASGTTSTPPPAALDETVPARAVVPLSLSFYLVLVIAAATVLVSSRLGWLIRLLRRSRG